MQQLPVRLRLFWQRHHLQLSRLGRGHGCKSVWSNRKPPPSALVSDSKELFNLQGSVVGALVGSSTLNTYNQYRRPRHDTSDDFTVFRALRVRCLALDHGLVDSFLDTSDLGRHDMNQSDLLGCNKVRLREFRELHFQLATSTNWTRQCIRVDQSANSSHRSGNYAGPK